MPETIYPGNLPGPQTFKVTAPKLPVFITAAEDITTAHVHVKAPDAKEVTVGYVKEGPFRENHIAVTVLNNTGLTAAFRRVTSFSEGTVHASRKGSVASGGDIIGNALGDGSIVQVGGSILDKGKTEKAPGVYIKAPVGSRVDVLKSFDVTVSGMDYLTRLSREDTGRLVVESR